MKRAIITVAAIAVAAVAFSQQGYEAKLLAVGHMAPAIKAKTHDGNAFDLSKIIGDTKPKAVLVNFWFSTCPPCNAEIPKLEEMYGKYKDNGLLIVGINGFEPANTVADFVKNKGITYPVLLNSTPTGGLAKAFGVLAYPTNYVLDGTGKIVARFVGFDEAQLDKALAKLGVTK
jgi:peroxiredoxin